MKKQPKPWIILSGLVFQIAAVMYLLIRAGTWADSYFQNQSNHYTLGLSILGNSYNFFNSFTDKKFKITFLKIFSNDFINMYLYLTFVAQNLIYLV